MRDRARGCNHTCRQLHIIAIAHHDRQRDHAHRNDGGRNRAGDRAQNGAHDDHGNSQATGKWTKQLARAFENIFRQTAALQNSAHQCEERNGQQQIIRDDAECAQRQSLQKAHIEMARENPQKAKEQADRGERKGHRKTDQHEQDHAAEHQGWHYAMRKH